MSAFERFEFGFPVPHGGLSHTPGDGEFLIVGKTGYRNKGPYLIWDHDYMAPHCRNGYFYRTGDSTYAPTWLGWIAQRPAIFDLLTSRN